MEIERPIGEIFLYKNIVNEVETWQCVKAISDDCSGCYNGGDNTCEGCDFPSCDSEYYTSTIERRKVFGICSLPCRKDKHNVIFKRIK